ncbi:MAG TPA: hypothetical protein P5205_15185 [Candidatus Paceibacterota bacterium]|nr:hypothetical protein [Verrucomicrobiota bacterium]HSA11707.1 hypothetical protein [Candidatus Paceibacterota bacterium]
MMRTVAFLLLALLATGAGWYFLRARPARTAAALPNPPAADAQNAAASATQSGSPETAGQPVAQPNQTVASAEPGAPPIPAAVEPLPPELASLPPATILESLRTTIRLYGQTFGGNPVGTNPEITAALNGDNPRQLQFLKTDGNRVNAKGELVDPWNTPYFFHQLSGTQTEIRSAGQDRIMYTTDDLIIQ